MVYTKFYTPALKKGGVKGVVFDLCDFEKVCKENPKVRALGGMKLLEDGYDSVVITPTTGEAWLKILKGYSWLHTQNGYIGAGAGGLNSMMVRKLKT
jgi:hypothetical protein